MFDRQYSASLIIACQGSQESEIKSTPYGEIRSRNGANLKFTANDAKGVYTNWSKHELEVVKHEAVPVEGHIYLEDPTKSEVLNAFSTINRILSKYPQPATSIDIFFAGHGECPSGALVLKDDILSAKELLHIINAPLASSQGARGLGLGLDSCYAGSFLIDIVVELQKKGHSIELRDAMVSSMHDERSWELSFLEHGAFTFAFLHPGNSYVKGKELNIAIERNDHKMIAKCLQGMVGMMASPVSFLTQGRQHPIQCLKGYLFEVAGLGEFSISDIEGAVTRESLVNYFEKIRQDFWTENNISKTF
jgi:hypothetical protein